MTPSLTTGCGRTSAAVLVAVFVLLAVTAVLRPTPAAAACHVAAFVETEVEAGEADGTVTLTVELQGRQPSCEGTVGYSTADGSAVAGEDYEEASGELSYTSGDDRVETIEVTLLDDGAGEESEDFTVALTSTSGSISSTGGPATVTVTDDDAGGGEDGATGDGADPDEPTEAATATEDAPDDGATATDEPTTDDATATDAAAEAADDDEDGGSSTVILVIAVLIVAAAAIGLFAARRRGT